MYVIRANPTIPAIGVIAANSPYSDVVEYIHEELIARASYDHPNFADDNDVVLGVLVRCLKTTRHMLDLKPFQRRRDDRGALAVLELHIMGNSK